MKSAASSIQPPKPAKVLPMQWELDNPLWLIFNGPVDPDEVEQIAVDPEPDIPRVEIRVMLMRLKERQGFLVPAWWKKSPQSFRHEFDQNLILLSSSTRLPRARQQSLTLEVLLSMWQEHLYG